MHARRSISRLARIVLASLIAEGCNAILGIDEGFQRPRPLDDGDCEGRLDCERTVFVTSALFTGNLGGLDGADAKCQQAADATTHPRVRKRKFRAWLSTRTTPAAGRLSKGTLPYRRPDGAIVIGSFSALLSFNVKLENAISDDEQGKAVASNDAWTGTSATGESDILNNCGDWTDDNAYGRYGGGFTDLQWTQLDVRPCTIAAHLYCFEQ